MTLYLENLNHYLERFADHASIEDMRAVKTSVQSLTLVSLEEYLTPAELVALMRTTGGRIYSLNKTTDDTTFITTATISWVAQGVVYQAQFADSKESHVDKLVNIITADSRIKSIQATDFEGSKTLVADVLDEYLADMSYALSTEDLNELKDTVMSRVIHNVILARNEAYRDAYERTTYTISNLRSFAGEEIDSPQKLREVLPAWFTEQSGGYVLSDYMLDSLTTRYSGFMELFNDTM